MREPLHVGVHWNHNHWNQVQPVFTICSKCNLDRKKSLPTCGNNLFLAVLSRKYKTEGAIYISLLGYNREMGVLTAF